MASKNGQELYRRCRPTKLKDVLGQDAAIKQLTGLIAKGFPHAVILSGASGVGKTTVARIVARQIGCKPENLYEYNSADKRGIDDVREIERLVRHLPFTGGPKVVILDEAHALTPDAQTALLKLLEECSDHVHFVICTTRSDKLLKTVLGRCKLVHFDALKPAALKDLVVSTLQRGYGDEGDRKITDEELDEIARVADGSGRRAVQLAEQALALDDPAERLEVIRNSDTQRKGIELARLLMNYKGKPTWDDCRKLLNTIDDEPEAVRRIVLGYCNTVMLGGGKLTGRAFAVIQSFRDHWYDCGQAGLTATCYELLNGS